MKYPTESLGHCVTAVDNSRDVFEEDLQVLLPLLNCKILRVDVTGLFGRVNGVCE